MIARNFRALLAAGTALSLALSASPSAAQLVRSGDLVDAIDSAGNPGQLTVVNTSATQTDMTVLAPVVIANWNSFNVTKGTTVNIAPDASLTQATLVNRVIGATASDISGTINAPNVNLWLLNQNGILFGSGASVNSASFFASTMGVTDQDVFDFYEGTDIAGNGSGTLRFSGSLGNGIATSSPDVNFVTDGTVLFVSEQLNLDATVNAGTGNIAFVAAADVNVSFTPGSPLSYAINARTTVAEQSIGGSVTGDSIDIQMISAAGVVGALLQVDATLTATTAVPTDSGVRLFAEQAGAGSVTVEMTGGVSSTGLVNLRTDGQLNGTAAISGSDITVSATAGAALGDLTATNSIRLDTGGILSAGSAEAASVSVGRTVAPTSASFAGAVRTGDFFAEVQNALTFGTVNGIAAISGLSTGSALSLENDTANLEVSGLVTAGSHDIAIRNSGDITIEAGGQVSGRIVAIAAGDQFINQSGSDAVIASDRWAIYLAAPAGNTFGGLDSGNTAIWNGTFATAAPDTLTGNRYVFAFQPTLTVTSTDTSKVYGTDLTGALDGFVTVSGVQPGVAGAFLGDTLTDVLSGTASITSAGSAPRASVAGGPYVMTVNQGTLSTSRGYALAFDSAGFLTVTPKAITGAVTVNNKTYDGTRTGTGTVTLDGVVSGDTVSTSGTTFTFADRNTGIGKTVAISGTTLTGADAGNYTLTIPASALADIIARALVITADNKQKPQGTPDPALTFQVGGQGLVAGDVISGALVRDPGELFGDYTITRGTIDAGSNYILTFEGGTLTIVRPAFDQVPLRSQALPGDIPAPSVGSGLQIDASGVCSQEEEATCEVAQ